MLSVLQWLPSSCLVSDEAEQHTCAFLEVQREVGKAESHEVWDSVKRALQREISDEPRPEKFIVSKYYRGITGILRLKRQDRKIILPVGTNIQLIQWRELNDVATVVV